MSADALTTTNDDRPATRERLLSAAVELLRVKGPSASGTAEILALADAPRGSFYFHFPDGKEQLVAEAVHRHACASGEQMLAALGDLSIPIWQRVGRLVNAVADALVADGFRLGCAVGSTALEVSATSPALRAATVSAFSSWTDLIARHLVQSGIDAQRAAVVADAVVAGLEGATMLARVNEDDAPLRHVATTLAATVAAEQHRIGVSGPAADGGRRQDAVEAERRGL